MSLVVPVTTSATAGALIARRGAFLLLVALTVLFGSADVAHAGSTEKLLAKTQKLVTRAEKRVAKLEVKRVVRVAKRDETIVARDAQIDECVLADLELADAEVVLEAALALPEDDDDKKTAVAAATKALKSATRASKRCAKRVARLDKSVARHDKRLAKLDEKLDDARAELLLRLEQLGQLSSPFTYRTFVDREVDVRVTRPDGTPHEGVRIVLATREPKPTKTPHEDIANRRCLGQGITGQDGRMATRVRLPSALDAVDVVVLAPGMRGPYTVEALRTEWGPTAPASRVTREVVALTEVTLVLEEVQ